MKVCISSGHGKYISGAVGPSPWGIHEHTEAVKVVDETARKLRELGAETLTYEDTVSKSQNENLDRLVDWHNAQGAHDLDVSVHFNSTDPQPSGPVGCEVFYGSSAGKAYAQKIVDAICTASGLKNRGPKDGDQFFFISNTSAVAVLVEVAFVNSHADVDIYHDKFSAICAAIAGAIAGEEVQPGPTPPEPERPERPERPPAPGDTPTLKKGSTGPDVVALQKALGCLEPDGDFGPTTDTWVRAFQAAAGGLTVDGIVGELTWEELDDLQDRVTSADFPLPADLASEIYTAAQESEIADFSWPDRAVMPPGYIAGMALSFGHAVRRLMDGDEAAELMSQAAGDPGTDALAFYKDEFAKLGMSNKVEGVDCLRHLFVMMISLGPRESSGKYCEGRDLSASNVESTTAESGLFQTSFNIKAGSPVIAPLLDEFWQAPQGWLKEFKEGITATKNNLDSYGTGDGARFQFLSRFCPLMHVLVTGCGLRVLKDHWGPIKRKEILLKKESDVLLKEVQAMVESAV